METINVHPYVTSSSTSQSTAWQALMNAVEEAKQRSNGEKVIVSFNYTQINQTNVYINQLILDPQIKLTCYHGQPIATILTTTACILLKTPIDKISTDKIECSVIEKTKVLAKKDKNIYDKTKAFKKDIDAAFDKLNTSFADVFCYFKNLSNDTSLQHLANNCKALPMFFDALKQVCLERNVNSLIVSMKDVDYRDELLASYFQKAIRELSDINIKIIFTDCTKGLENRLRLHIKQRYTNGTTEDVLNFINKLGTGRVVLLTKLKDHNSDSLSYRENDEVIAQYIGIISSISDDTIGFKYTGFGNLKTYHDLLAQYGSPDDFDELVMHNISIPVEVLGCTNIRVAKSWHLDLLDGNGESDSKFYYIPTNTSATIQYSDTVESVLLPEFIRRSLKSWHISFNEKALQSDVLIFKKNIKRN